MSAARLEMRSLRIAMIRHGVDPHDTDELAALLRIQSLDDAELVLFQNLLGRVPRARSDLRHAFIKLHNELVPDELWDVHPDVHTWDDWHGIEVHYAMQLLNEEAYQNALALV